MKPGLVAVIIFVLSLAFPATTHAREFKSADEIVEEGFNYLRDKTSYALLEMTIHRPDWERRMMIKAWTKGQEQSLIKIISPAKDNGNATLKKVLKCGFTTRK
jgi:hypothetical protein